MSKSFRRRIEFYNHTALIHVSHCNSKSVVKLLKDLWVGKNSSVKVFKLKNKHKCKVNYKTIFISKINSTVVYFQTYPSAEIFGKYWCGDAKNRKFYLYADDGHSYSSKLIIKSDCKGYNGN